MLKLKVNTFLSPIDDKIIMNIIFIIIMLSVLSPIGIQYDYSNMIILFIIIITMIILIFFYIYYYKFIYIGDIYVYITGYCCFVHKSEVGL